MLDSLISFQVLNEFFSLGNVKIFFKVNKNNSIRKFVVTCFFFFKHIIKMKGATATIFQKKNYNYC